MLVRLELGVQGEQDVQRLDRGVVHWDVHHRADDSGVFLKRQVDVRGWQLDL